MKNSTLWTIPSVSDQMKKSTMQRVSEFYPILYSDYFYDCDLKKYLAYFDVTLYPDDDTRHEYRYESQPDGTVKLKYKFNGGFRVNLSEGVGVSLKSAQDRMVVDIKRYMSGR